MRSWGEGASMQDSTGVSSESSLLECEPAVILPNKPSLILPLPRASPGGRPSFLHSVTQDSADRLQGKP